MATMTTANAQIRKLLRNKSWRMNNLYTIVDEAGIERPYRQRMNQKHFADARHGVDILLKGRQWGGTTEIDLDMLDDCMFIPNLQCGIIAHTLADAQEIFATKVKFPYDHLPAYLQYRVKAIKKDGCTLKLSNGSSIRVAVSFRSATTHRLHISEFAKICAKFPKRAEEIVTGTMPSVHPQMGGRAVIEGTAEGPAGAFYDWCIQAQSETEQARKEGRELGALQSKFHFYTWHQDPKNAISPLGVVVSDELKEYFEYIAEDKGIITTPEQQSWYAYKRDGSGGLGKLMKREHPSFPAEAFEQSVQGAVFGEEMDDCRTDGRIGLYPWVKNIPVHTFWDLGYRNSTCVGYVQFIQREVRVIDYSAERGRGAAYHADQVNSKPYNYCQHHMPHDVMNHEKGTGIVLKDTYRSLLKEPIRTVNRPKLKRDSIEALCDMFGAITFNAKTCNVGDKENNLVQSMCYYRYDWDEEAKVFSKVPIGDWAADPADMMQTLAMQFREGTIDGKRLGMPRSLQQGRAKTQSPYEGWHVLG
ncbi:hypothetical protein KAR91_81405 [Candidatus Pacearchaeota archaeon]|nr:hypothetical protein [Candidatus Pacearchaeota archaeon]